SYLHKHDYSLKETCIAKVQACKTKRDAMIEAFQREFPAGESWAKKVKWSKPDGGYFLVVDIPFNMTDELLKECVEKYQVICCPMSFFCLDEEAGANQIRLAFSNLSIEKIAEGMRRLATFIKNKQEGNNQNEK
ncbi:MAG: aminotransferase class I/II-fold pyridoxal phosphate-dependent enzyme, partial [bacterium]|nr:aminotransferase class I/II-fold pyridoxal phosphate-dependent enzyme [bacterium]